MKYASEPTDDLRRRLDARGIMHFDQDAALTCSESVYVRETTMFEYADTVWTAVWEYVRHEGERPKGLSQGWPKKLFVHSNHGAEHVCKVTADELIKIAITNVDQNIESGSEL